MRDGQIVLVVRLAGHPGHQRRRRGSTSREMEASTAHSLLEHFACGAETSFRFRPGGRERHERSAVLKEEMYWKWRLAIYDLGLTSMTRDEDTAEARHPHDPHIAAAPTPCGPL